MPAPGTSTRALRSAGRRGVIGRPAPLQQHHGDGRGVRARCSIWTGPPSLLGVSVQGFEVWNAGMSLVARQKVRGEGDASAAALQAISITQDARISVGLRQRLS
jgi:hypothetical protein